MDRFYDVLNRVYGFRKSSTVPQSRIKDGFDHSEPSVNGLFILVAFQLSNRLQERRLYKSFDTMTAFLTVKRFNPWCRYILACCK